jgi:pilus assembly protein Flp/PilA
LKRLIKRFLTEEDGVTAIEYALIASLIAIVIVVMVRGVGLTLLGTFTDINNELQ